MTENPPDLDPEIQPEQLLDTSNMQDLLNEMAWLELVIDQVIRSYLMHEGHEENWEDIELPDLSESDSIFASQVNEWNLSKYQRLALALALAPQLKPEVLDVFFGRNQLYDRGFTEFGGMVDAAFSGFIPTGQTLLFLMSGSTPYLLSEAHDLFAPDEFLMKEQVLHLKDSEEHLPPWSGMFSIDPSWLHYFRTGEKVLPELSASFPAQPITTPLDWNELVLEDQVMEQVLEIRDWIEYGETLMEDWNLKNKIKPGFRTLFYGAPGTGKTLTASLLGKSTNREVFRVDLSMVVSKYIGETEKNLSKIFDIAAYKDWILFFDEADALFGKRTQATTSNDRHANQQTGYLLQRIEDFPGIVILASNLKANMDEAFTRRFQSMIHFDIPSADQRFKLWENAFLDTCELDEDVDLSQIAEDYELAGGAIINVLRYCALTAIRNKTKTVGRKLVHEGIRREFAKDNRTLHRMSN